MSPFSFFGFGFWFGVSDESTVTWEIFLKNTVHYRPLVSTISLRKRLSPKYFRQFILSFSRKRPRRVPSKKGLSLKIVIKHRPKFY